MREVPVPQERRAEVLRALHRRGHAQALLAREEADLALLLHGLKASLGLEGELADFDSRRLVFTVHDGADAEEK